MVEFALGYLVGSNEQAFLYFDILACNHAVLPPTGEQESGSDSSVGVELTNATVTLLQVR